MPNPYTRCSPHRKDADPAEWCEGRAVVDTQWAHLWAHAYVGAWWYYRGKRAQVVAVHQGPCKQYADCLQACGEPEAVTLAERDTWLADVAWDHDAQRLVTHDPTPVARVYGPTSTPPEPERSSLRGAVAVGGRSTWLAQVMRLPVDAMAAVWWAAARWLDSRGA